MALPLSGSHRVVQCRNGVGIWDLLEHYHGQVHSVVACHEASAFWMSAVSLLQRTQSVWEAAYLTVGTHRLAVREPWFESLGLSPSIFSARSAVARCKHSCETGHTRGPVGLRRSSVFPGTPTLRQTPQRGEWRSSRERRRGRRHRAVGRSATGTSCCRGTRQRRSRRSVVRLVRSGGNTP